MRRPPIELHHTAIMYLPCGWRFQQQKLRGVEEAQTDFALDGSIGHTAAAMYAEHLVNEMRRTNGKRCTQQSAYVRIMDSLLQEHKITGKRAQAIMDTGANFMDRFKLKPGHEYAIEQRLYVDRDFKPMAVVMWTDPATPDAEPVPVYNVDEPGEPPEKGCLLATMPDCNAGTPDLVEYDNRHALLTDYKMGNLHGKDAFEAQDNVQLKLYAALWLWHHPEHDDVTTCLWAPKYRRPPSLSEPHTRETLLPWAEQYLNEKWARIDHLWDTHGESDWPTEPGEACHHFCRVACNDEYWEKVYA